MTGKEWRFVKKDTIVYADGAFTEDFVGVHTRRAYYEKERITEATDYGVYVNSGAGAQLFIPASRITAVTVRDIE